MAIPQLLEIRFKEVLGPPYTQVWTKNWETSALASSCKQNAFRCGPTFKVRMGEPGWQSGNALDALNKGD